jgi:hypothetical protein
VLLSAAPADTNSSGPLFGPPEACSGRTPLTNCIVAAFDKADVVALHDRHRQKGDSDLRIALVRDPMFAQKVRNIVVEFGNGRHQVILDRYIAGEAVKPQDLKPVWQDTTQLKVWDSPLYADFFAAVREVNLKLPKSARIRVLAGDPPLDWSAINDRASYLRVASQRDETPASIVQKLVSSKQKVLLIYGSNHLYHSMGLTNILDARLPRKIISVGTMSGTDALQQKLREAAGVAPRPVLISLSESDTGRLNANEYLGKQLKITHSLQGRSPWEAVRDYFFGPSQPPPPDPAKENFAFPDQTTLSKLLDAYVFFGRKTTDDPRIDPDPSIYNQNGYGAELERRKRCIGE